MGIRVNNTNIYNNLPVNKKVPKVVDVGLEFKEKPYRKWLKEFFNKQDLHFNLI